MQGRGLDHWADILVLVLYFVLVLIVGMWSLWRPNRNSVQGYFLAGRDMTWLPIGASLFASNIGSEHFIGLAGVGAASGIAVSIYEWSSMPLVMCLAWLFLPVYISAQVYTLPEYLGKRFGGTRLRLYLSVLVLILYIITKVAVSMYAGALFIQLALGWDMYVSIVVLLLVTSIYTILGGLAAVIYTDTLQTFIMMGGAITLCIMSFNKVGSFENLRRLYMEAVPTTNITHNVTSCSAPPDDAFHMFRDWLDSDNPWLGLTLQATIGCLWYWCADQVIVQRTLAAKSLSHAKAGAIVTGYLKLLPLFLMIFPGMISRALYPNEVACSDPEECTKICDNPVGCSNIAYPKLVIELLPIGVRGLLMAVMMSAITSSLTSVFNSASTIFTMDLWRKWRGKATERELLIVGRLFVLVMCGVSILWIPLVRSSQGGQLFIYIQAIQGYLGTPIGILFLSAIIWKRMNEQGAFWGIIVGHSCGLVRMVIEFVYSVPGCGEPETRPAVLYRVNYTYFCAIMIVVTTLVIILVSLITTPQEDKDLAGLTWWTRSIPSLRTSHSSGIPKTNEGANKSQKDSMLLKKKSFWNRWLSFVCGSPDTHDHDSGTSTLLHAQTFMYENPKWRKIININAVIALTLMAFVVGFFH